MNRRGFLKAILAAGVAPAVVGSGILMPLKLVQAVEWDIDFIPEYERFAVEGKSLSEVIAEVMRERAPQIAANVAMNNAILRRLKNKGLVRPFTGGLYLGDILDE